MASRITNHLKTLSTEQVVVEGSFAPAGTGAPTYPDDKKRGWSVARSGVGVYLITFEDGFQALSSCLFSARVADATPTIVQGGDYDAAAKTLQVRVLEDDSGWGLVDLAADADNVISFACVFRNASV